MWQTLQLNSRLHLFRAINDNQGTSGHRISVWLSDFRQVWSEQLHQDGLLERTKENNPHFGSNDATLLDLVIRNMAIVPQLAAETEGSNVRLLPEDVDAEAGGLVRSFRLKVYVGEDRIPLHISWRLRREEDEVFYSTVTESLLRNLLSEQHKCSLLLDVIRRKDAEIEQYKLAGAEVVRKQLITAPFDADAFSVSHQHLTNGSFAALLSAASSRQQLASSCGLATLYRPPPPEAEVGSPSQKLPPLQQRSPSQRAARQQRLQRKLLANADVVRMRYDEEAADADEESHASCRREEAAVGGEKVPTTPQKAPVAKKMRTKLNL